jgi:hypothetical protein
MDFEQYREQFYFYYKSFYKRSDSYKRLCDEIKIIGEKKNKTGNGLIGSIIRSGFIEEGFKLLGATPIGRMREQRGEGEFNLPPYNHDFIVSIDITLGLDVIKKQLDIFCKETLCSIKLFKQQLNKENWSDINKYIDLLDFIRDGKDNINYFSLVNGKPFSLWERCLVVYDSYEKQEKKNWIEIARELDIWGKTSENCEQTARTAVKRYHKQAVRLIKSTEDGTFPG